MTKLDLTKPLQTIHGKPVRIICTDRKNTEYPVLVLITDHQGKEVILDYTSEGLNEDLNKEYQLMNVPPQIIAVKRWVNLYDDINNPMTMHTTYDLAARFITSRILLARKEVIIEFYEGEGL